MTQVDQPDDDREDRLADDAALYARLQAQKFQGPEWERFVHELLAYGLTRVKATIGVMHIVLPVSGACIPASRGDVEELANDVVLAALRVFVKCGLVERRWNPACGGSLKTYFVGACKLVLREKLHDWTRRAQKISSDPIPRVVG
jgi:RNA polymerase sigma-70 factor (ECF subfamily)